MTTRAGTAAAPQTGGAEPGAAQVPITGTTLGVGAAQTQLAGTPASLTGATPVSGAATAQRTEAAPQAKATTFPRTDAAAGATQTGEAKQTKAPTRTDGTQTWEAAGTETQQPETGEYSNMMTITGTSAHTCLLSGNGTKRLSYGATGPFAGKTCLRSRKDT